ncbi:minor capsid protein [Lysinibacillus sp. RC79]|uniref:phage head morphogenesis protein n=1 Tax=Lysinibacillus sp. RC79 TaxID=3156296 RepID=UPI003515D1F1
MSKKVPITRFPDASAVAYSRAIRKMVLELGDETLNQFEKYVEPLLIESRQDSPEFVVDGILDNIKRMLEAIKNKADKVFVERKTHSASRKFVNSINRFNKHNIENQLAVKGIEPTQREPWLDSFLNNKIKDNVSFIKNIEDEYLSEIENVIRDGVKEGRTAKQIREQLVERVKVAESRAQFIAVDQTGSILGQMTAERHQQIGIDKFKWLTSHDERVRDSHKELSDKTFSYDDLPTVNGREVLPGEDYRCRCVAIPVFDDEELY